MSTRDSIINVLNNIDIFKHMISLNLVTHHDMVSVYIAFWNKFKFQYHELVSISTQLKKKNLILKKILCCNYDHIITEKDIIQDVNFYKYIHFANLRDCYNHVNFYICKSLAKQLSINPIRLDNVLMPNKSRKISNLSYLELRRKEFETKYTKIVVDTMYDDLRIERGDKNIIKIGAVNRFAELTDIQRYNLTILGMVIKNLREKTASEQAQKIINDELQALLKYFNNHKQFTIDYDQILSMSEYYETREYVCMCSFVRYSYIGYYNRSFWKKSCKCYFTRKEIMENS